MAEGEFIEEDYEMYVGTKVGQFTISQRHKLSPALEIEEIFEGDIYREHKTSQQKAQEDINATFKNFSEKYGIKVPSAGPAAAKRGQRPAGETPEVLAKI